jgi:hypothetical protein
LTEGGGKRHSAPEPNGTPIIQIAADHRTEHIKEKDIKKAAQTAACPDGKFS